MTTAFRKMMADNFANFQDLTLEMNMKKHISKRKKYLAYRVKNRKYVCHNIFQHLFAISLRCMTNGFHMMYY